MSLIEQIDNDLKDAMRSKDALALSTLRMLKSAIKNREIELNHELNDQESGEMVTKSVKQRRESITEYQKGDRVDLVKREESEIKVLQKYLPKQLGETEISKIIDEAIKSVNANGPADMGKVMGTIIPKVKGKADGALVSKLVKERLGN